MMELRIGQTENLADRPIGIKASSLPVSDDHQKQVENHGFVAQTMQISAVKDLVVDDRVAACPSHETMVEQWDSRSNLVLYLAAHFLPNDVEPASTAPYQADLVLYLALEDVPRDDENRCASRLRRRYLVLYLATLFSPAALIIRISLAPRLDFAVAPPEITPRIRHQPSLVALRLAFRPAPLIGAGFLGPSRPWIRFVKPPAVDTPLLSALSRFHPLILTDKGTLVSRDVIREGIKGTKTILYGEGMKQRINVGPMIIRIRSLFDIAYSHLCKQSRMLNLGLFTLLQSSAIMEGPRRLSGLHAGLASTRHGWPSTAPGKL